MPGKQRQDSEIIPVLNIIPSAIGKMNQRLKNAAGVMGGMLYFC
jgi:hypothetical protein